MDVKIIESPRNALNNLRIIKKYYVKKENFNDSERKQIKKIDESNIIHPTSLIEALGIHSKEKKGNKKSGKLENNSISPDLNSQDIFGELKLIMKEYTTNNKEKLKSKKTLLNQEGFINHQGGILLKFQSDKKLYNDRKEAFGIINKNKEIYDKITMNLQNQKEKLIKAKVKEIKENEVFATENVKITNIIKNDLLRRNSLINKSNNEGKSISFKNIRTGSDLYGEHLHYPLIFPESREQFASCYEYPYTFIFGGMSTKMLNDIWKIDSNKNFFTKIHLEKNDLNARYGHTITYFNKKLIIFGGKTKINEFDFLCDIEVIDLETNSYHSPVLNTKGNLKLRKNHIAELIGTSIFIHGGVGEEGQVLSDCQMLNLNPNFKWVNVSFSDLYPSQPLTHHSSCCVIPKDLKFHPKFNIYQNSDSLIQNNYRKMRNKILEKGIYLFGGKNENGLSNKLFIIKIFIKPLEWIEAETCGKTPIARYLHTFNYYEEGNFCILHGGRNDLMSENGGLNDFHILDLSKLEWVEIKIYSFNKFTVFRRYGHSSEIHNNKILIFGGMNNLGFLPSNIFTVNLDYFSNYSETNAKSNDQGIRIYFGSEEMKSIKKSPVKSKKTYRIPSLK